MSVTPSTSVRELLGWVARDGTVGHVMVDHHSVCR